MVKIKWHRLALTVALLLTLILAVRGFITQQPAGDKAAGLPVRLYLHSENRVISIPLEEYLAGVVAAEMPASFAKEALKAQAVAARTYILRRIPPFRGEQSKPALHEGADICDLPEHGQAWISQSAMLERWGKAGFQSNYDKIKAAVSSTEGLVLTYRGEIINPLYHASCGGLGTESAKTAWGRDIPYLTEVTCPENKADPRNKRQYEFTVKELDRLLGTDLEAFPVIKLTGPGSPIAILERSGAGSVKSVRLGDKQLSGALIRSKLQLASTRFTMKAAKDGNILIETTGYGHGVGLCQRGADALAEKGEKYQDILGHYYPGTELAKLRTGSE